VDDSTTAVLGHTDGTLWRARPVPFCLKGLRPDPKNSSAVLRLVVIALATRQQADEQRPGG